jgi:hypothetical protein
LAIALALLPAAYGVYQLVVEGGSAILMAEMIGAGIAVYFLTLLSLARLEPQRDAAVRGK